MNRTRAEVVVALFEYSKLLINSLVIPLAFARHIQDVV